MRLLILISALCLSGCASTGYDRTDWDNWPVPSLKTYNKDFVDRLADEIEAVPPHSALRVCVADLILLRRQVCAINDRQEACQKMRQNQ